MRKEVLFNIYKDQNEYKDIYILVRGRKKRVVLQALKGYFIILNLKEDYKLIDLSLYDNIYYKIALIIDRLGSDYISMYLNKWISNKIYSELKNYINNTS